MILEPEPGLSKVPFSLTELRIQQLSRKPLIFHLVYMTQPSEARLNQNAWRRRQACMSQYLHACDLIFPCNIHVMYLSNRESTEVF